MNVSFWHQRWEQGKIAFHESVVNPLLVKYFNELNLAQGSRVFLPLCGMTEDISWLLRSSYKVVGIDLSELAIKQLFKELGVEPEVSSRGEMVRYKAKNIDIFVGDFFNLSVEDIGFVDAVYDRAALVALPSGMRKRYSHHLMEITGRAPQLLICYEYNQQLLNGPPFSINAETVSQYYDDSYDLINLQVEAVQGGLKGLIEVVESVWLLQNLNR